MRAKGNEEASVQGSGRRMYGKQGSKCKALEREAGSEDGVVRLEKESRNE